MKLKNLKYMASALIAAAFLVSCSGDDIVQNGQGNNNGNSPAGVVFEGENSTPEHNNPGTRTTATHVIGQGAKVFWEATDEIWVKDDTGTFQKSTSTAFPNPSNQEHAQFGLTTGSFTGASHQVVYTGKGSASATEVEIKASQTQSVTNSFAHLGESGDCGIATATKSGSRYNFTLEHKAAYLAIYPSMRKYDALHKNVKIEKIVITSTNPTDYIAGKYAFSATTGLGSSPSPTSGASNTITLTTTSGEISVATKADTCYYVVIAPGTHTLKLEYYIKDPTTNVSTTISKDLGAIPCNEGKITDISAWIDKDITYFPNLIYSQWGAQQHFWAGYEWNSAHPEQVVRSYSGPSSSFPAPTSGDPRYADNTAYALPTGTIYEATSSLFSNVPNANEMSWYIVKGDPYKDADKIWTAMGHLYKSGVWFKKKAKIPGFSDTVGANGIDYRISPNYVSSPTVQSGTPTNIEDYFFLPNAGFLQSDGYISNLGQQHGGYGYYWTSTALAGYTSSYPSAAYWLQMTPTPVLSLTYVTYGACIMPEFE